MASTVGCEADDRLGQTQRKLFSGSGKPEGRNVKPMQIARQAISGAPQHACVSN